MPMFPRPWGAMHYRTDGGDGPCIVFANSLGTDLRLWDALLPLLPPRYCFVRYDKRGHGLSDLGGTARVDDLADDLIALIEGVAKGPVVLVGLSIGGLIAQNLTARRPDLVRALVLSNTATRMGTPESWQARINAVVDGGLASIADAVMERWFAPAFRATPDIALWRNMLIRTPQRGYTAACATLAHGDQTDATRGLRLPVLVIAGECDGASPPDLVRATADIIAGARFNVIAGAGHLPCVEAPEACAALLTPFLKDHAHD